MNGSHGSILLTPNTFETQPAPITIQVEQVSKRFIIHHERPHSFQEMAIGWGRRFIGKQPATSNKELFWALRDINLQIRRGETVGLIGRNGSGKSTLLKLLTGILQPTAGTINVNGRISALLELGSGFHPDVSGRENIFFTGSLMGIGKREMEKHYRTIVEFSELERFIDMPLKHYSSGMHMRLAFATAVVVEPEILLIDEILAVGDEAFARKSFNRIRELQRHDRTIVVVSHSLDLLNTLCSRLVWLNEGKLVESGSPAEVIEHYLAATGVPAP